MAQLRSFLIVYVPGDDLIISVHRDLDSARSAWRSTTKSFSASSALFHVGFERPESDSTRSLLSQYSGKILVTEPARWCLPRLDSVSRGSIGSVESSTGEFGVPTYLALSGWGYEIADLEIEEPLAEVPTAGATGRKDKPRAEWVAALASDEPSNLYEELENLGVRDDQDYVLARHQLAERLRDEIDLARFSYLWPFLTDGDLNQLGKILPDYVLRESLAGKGLSVRATNIFDRLNFQTFDDVVKFGQSALMRQANFGRRTLREIFDTMVGLAEDGPQGAASAVSRVGETRLIDHVRLSLDKLTPKARAVLSSRLGEDGKRKTLEEIASELGVTRERIRQIEKKHVQKIIQDYYWDDEIGNRLKSLLTGRTRPLFLDLIEVEDEWFSGVARNAVFASNIIEYFTKNNPTSFFVTNIQSRLIISKIGADGWGELVRSTTNTLSSKTDAGWSRDDVEHFCSVMAGSQNVDELASLLFEIVNEKAIYTGDESKAEESQLIEFGNSISAQVRSILIESDIPLHFSEVARRYREKNGTDFPERHAHVALGNIGALLLGRGIYGLPQHIRIDEAEKVEIADAVFEIVQDGPSGRQWHCHELMEELEKRASFEDELGDHYVLNVILQDDDRFSYLGRLVWALTGSDSMDTGDRVDVLQACLSILDREKRPMTLEELKSELAQYRGVSRNFQLHPSETLLRLDDGAWALSEWY